VEQRKSEENHIALAEVSFSFFLSVASFENKKIAQRSCSQRFGVGHWSFCQKTLSSVVGQ